MFPYRLADRDNAAIRGTRSYRDGSRTAQGREGEQVQKVERMAVKDAVSVDELWRHLEAIASTVRLSGTPGEAAAFDHAERELAAMGFAVSRYEAEALIGYPISSSLAVISPDQGEIRCNGYALTPATPDVGMTAELIHVGSSLSTSYDGYDARGKIVVADGIAVEDATVAATRAGAVGQIFVNPERIHEMCISPVWGTP